MKSVVLSCLLVVAQATEKWLSCCYGVGGHLALAERLPDETDRCTVRYYRRPAFNSYDIQVSYHAAKSQPGR